MIWFDEGIWWGDLLLLWVSKQEAQVKTQGFVENNLSYFFSTYFINMNNDN